MKNHKQLLADTYLALLAIPFNDKFRIKHQTLYATVLSTLAYELGEGVETVQRIFERMAMEDRELQICPSCNQAVANRATHNCTGIMK